MKKANIVMKKNIELMMDSDAARMVIYIKR